MRRTANGEAQRNLWEEADRYTREELSGATVLQDHPRFNGRGMAEHWGICPSWIEPRRDFQKAVIRAANSQEEFMLPRRVRRYDRSAWTKGCASAYQRQMQQQHLIQVYVPGMRASSITLRLLLLAGAGLRCCACGSSGKTSVRGGLWTLPEEWTDGADLPSLSETLPRRRGWGRTMPDALARRADIASPDWRSAVVSQNRSVKESGCEQRAAWRYPCRLHGLRMR